MLALALHEALRLADGDVDRFRSTVMAMFDDDRVELDALRAAADAAAPAPLDDGQVREGLAQAAASHRRAQDEGVFGTPTLGSDGRLAYLKLSALPGADRGRATFDAVLRMLHDLPEVAEFKRP